MSFSSLPTPSTSYPIESLDQLFTRVASRNRPSLTNLEPNIFPPVSEPAFLPRQIIEITGDSNTGKTHLLMEFMARCVLPQRFGGCEADVLFVDTEHHFQIFKLAAMLEKHLRNSTQEAGGVQELNAEETRSIINASLKRCHLLKCHSPEQLQLAIFGLDRMFRENSNAALLALDAVSTFYWLEATPIRKDTYAKTLVGKLANVVKHHGAVLVYVRPESFKSRSASGDSSISAVRPYPINYCIRLEAAGKGSGETVADCEAPAASFECVLITGKSSEVIRTLGFSVDSFGIHWDESK